MEGTYVIPCCFNSSLSSDIKGVIISLYILSFGICCSITKIISASFFGTFTLNESPMSILFPPTLQFAESKWKIIKFFLRYDLH